jgi:hypothetical protein
MDNQPYPKYTRGEKEMNKKTKAQEWQSVKYVLSPSPGGVTSDLSLELQRKQGENLFRVLWHGTPYNGVFTEYAHAAELFNTRVRLFLLENGRSTDDPVLYTAPKQGA